MVKPQSLADYLGTAPAAEGELLPYAENITGDAKAFAEAVLNSYDFRFYIVSRLKLGDLPPAILMRIMDMAGWPGGAKRVEHTGKDGKPIESITEVRRVVIRPYVPEPTEAAEPESIVH